jgi:hypothetical protein
MLSYWPEILIVGTVACGFVYLYRDEVSCLVSRPRKDADHSEAFEDAQDGWKQTGHIDFSVPDELRANAERVAEPHFFYLTVEEYRLVETIGGGTAVERRWRRGALADAREVAQNYHRFLQEHPEKAFHEELRKLIGATRLLEQTGA